MVDDDMTLLERWRAGDEKAGNQLIHRHYDATFKQVHRRLRDSDAARDATQQVFVELLNKRDVITRDVGAYIRKIAFYKAYRYRPRSDRVIDSVSGLAAPQTEVSALLTEREEMKLMVKALRALSVEDQLLLAWVYADDKSQDEIAGVLELRTSQINGRIHRARRRLRKEIEAMEASAVKHSTLGGFDTWLKSTHGKESYVVEKLKGRV